MTCRRGSQSKYDELLICGCAERFSVHRIHVMGVLACADVILRVQISHKGRLPVWLSVWFRAVDSEREYVNCTATAGPLPILLQAEMRTERLFQKITSLVLNPGRK